MAKDDDIEKEREAALHTLLGKLGYLRRVCPHARLTFTILLGLMKEGEILWVQRMEKFTFVKFESGNLTIYPQGGVLLTLHGHKK